MRTQKILGILMLVTICFGRAYANEDSKVLEICRASIEASDAGWAAYETLVSDLNKISINGDACTSRESAWPKCESSLQKLVNNNLEPLLMAQFARPYIDKLNELCAPHIRDEKGVLKISAFESKAPAVIVEDSAALLIKGFQHTRTRSLYFEKLPSNSRMTLETSVFVDPKTGVERYKCLDLTVDLVNFIATEGESNLTVDQWPKTNVCFDSLRFVNAAENDVTLEKVMSRTAD